MASHRAAIFARQLAGRHWHSRPRRPRDKKMTKHPKEAERLKKIVEDFPNITVTVLGDLVADEFVFGEISRVSREAPVLILKHRDRTVLPGGAANAANNLADLGVNVLPAGIVGD